MYIISDVENLFVFSIGKDEGNYEDEGDTCKSD